MSAIVKCDCCGAAVPYTKAVHVRFYGMTSATTYKESDAKEVMDMCHSCYKKLKRILKQEATTNAD